MKSLQDVVAELLPEFNSMKLCRESLTALVTALGQTPQVRRIGEDFVDRNKYPDRPEFTLSDRNPSIWLLGWREGDFTEVHDHGDSEIAIYVLTGCVTEDVYGCLGPADANEYDVTASFSRQFLAGQTLCCPKPYTHRMGNLYPEIAISLHAYGPALESMRMFDHDQRSNRLRKKDCWRNEH